MSRIIIFSVGLIMLACSNSGQQKENTPSQNTTKLGVANLEVNGLPEAKVDFEKGLLLLYSFEFEDAREAFREALQKDSSMAMTYWGIAMTYNHPLWRTQFTDSALAILELRKENKAEPKSALETDFLASLDVLYEEGKSKAERDKNYAAYFENFAKKYPKNQEVAAFYSLALLGSVSDGREVKTYEKAGEVAANILKEHPKHPGALHYVIHAYDDPEHAELAMDAANAYAKVAPEASHALHMPSHIFIAKGMWDKVIASNIDAYDASVERMKRKGLKDGARSYHAYDWLHYAYLQKGNTEKAKEMLSKMAEYTKSDPTKGARAYLLDMKGNYLLDTQDWNGNFAEISVDISDLNIMANAKQIFQNSVIAFNTKNKKELENAISSLTDDIRQQALYLDTTDFKICLPTQRSAPMPSDIAAARTILLQIKALKAWSENDKSKTENLLQQSIATADTLSFSFGPPEIQKPVHELYADWLLAQNRYDEAIKAYEKALSQAPKRRLSEVGLKKARKLADESKLASKI